ncbi:DNA polymerase III subunit gamma/tau [Candidatus Vidania fulgoroideorum]
MFLYNKYRPKNLNDFFGQKKIIKFIKYFINKKNPLSFIFYGPKGTGKTSLSRIYFKILNCKKNNICNKCKSCKIKINKNSDYIEIDAASHRKIDEITEIFKYIDYIPVNGSYKIFSIDEAQMLSKYSFNFLLKKIELLPEHSIILFLTTNIKKIPDTIISRCFIMKFQSFNNYEVFNYIKKICNKESIKITKKSIFLIANNSKGSLRDSLILLEHSKALSEKIINSKIIYNILDDIKENMIFNFFYIFIKKKKKNINKFIFLLFLKKKNPLLFLNKVIEFSNKIIFFKKNYKYFDFFFFNFYEKKYINYFLKNKRYLKIKKIRNIIAKEIDFFKKFENKFSGIKYIFSLIMDCLNIT